MPEELISFVTTYGYLAIFILVFLQEVGLPNPFPNELLLIFSGYLSYKGLLYLPLVILTALSADFIGTNILYFLFYTSGTFILKKSPKWLPLSAGRLERLTSGISRGGRLSIFIFRLAPFTRGYTSVITGLLQVRPGIFLPIAFVTAGLWSITYVLTGYLIGPSWNLFIQNIGKFKFIMLALLALLSLMLLFFLFNRRKTKVSEKAGF